MILNKAFYNLKPLIPRWFQIAIRRRIALQKLKKNKNIWPIDETAGQPPANFTGWPDKKKFALILMHDVDTQKGHDNCHNLMDLEEKLGFRSTFNFVPERYTVSKKLRQDLVKRGFEVGVHGLKHDGKLFSSQSIFNDRAIRINHYLREWCADGFSSPAMHHRLDWMHVLNIMYATSTFDTDPFEPQPDGVRTIFPFWVAGPGLKGYLEIPYTLPQDFTLFVLMKEENNSIWKKKLEWIANKGGVALLNTHPDYLNFNNGKMRIQEYPSKLYSEFLEFLDSNYSDKYWHVRPVELARFWICNMERNLLNNPKKNYG